MSLIVPHFQEVNRYKGKNYPIMNVHERTLSVLACRVGPPPFVSHVRPLVCDRVLVLSTSLKW